MSLIVAALLANMAESAPSVMGRLPPCEATATEIAEPCIAETSFDPVELANRLGIKESIWWIVDDRLTMIARPTVEKWVSLCCAVQTPLEPIAGSELAAISVRVPRINEAVLDISVWPSVAGHEEVFRGPQAKPAPERRTPPKERLVRRAFVSKWLGETRPITIYLPPRTDMKQKMPVVYLADNLAASFAPIAEAAIMNGKMMPIILVGMDAVVSAGDCYDTACDRRGWEYKLDRNGGDWSAASAFGRHLRFVTDEVIPFVEANYPASPLPRDRIVGGSSNGGHWALAAAALRPDLFGKVMALSSSGRDGLTIGMRLGGARVYGGAGLFEPDFAGFTRAAVEAAKRAGAETKMDVEVSGHSLLSWDLMFADAMPWLLAESADAK